MGSSQGEASWQGLLVTRIIIYLNLMILLGTKNKVARNLQQAFPVNYNKLTISCRKESRNSKVSARHSPVSPSRFLPRTRNIPAGICMNGLGREERATEGGELAHRRYTFHGLTLSISLLHTAVDYFRRG